MVCVEKPLHANGEFYAQKRTFELFVMVSLFLFLSSQAARAYCSVEKPSDCRPYYLCENATMEKNGERVWSTQKHFFKVVQEAKRRGLSCNVGKINKPKQISKPSLTYAQLCSINSDQIKLIQNYLKILNLYPYNIDGLAGSGTIVAIRKAKGLLGQSASSGDCVSDRDLMGIKGLAEINLCYQKGGADCAENNQVAKKQGICSQNPEKCGAVELCQRAVETKNGKPIWRTDSYGQSYASAAKKIGLTCNVANDNKSEKTFRVANGTGFYVSGSGFVVTNQHVINGCNEVQVHNGGDIAAATLIGQDKINDLALLKTKLKAKSVFKLSPENPYLLQDIVAAGFPFGESISSSIKVTKGVVSSLSGLGDNSGQIQIDAALQPGNSGGPIIDNNGNVVGVSVAKLDVEKSLERFGAIPENVNFGIKLSNLKTFLDDNDVDYEIGNDREIRNSELGKLATETTVLLSCWMTEARYEDMQNQKAMFGEPLKK